ncbi:MAG: hypothetical protein C5S52_00925 [ANME-2 cluster archaeon]|nr:hypothetical protein [ANME-2 cluster archaeon]
MHFFTLPENYFENTKKSSGFWSPPGIGADVPCHPHPSEKINTSTHKPVLLYDEIAKPGMALDC